MRRLERQRARRRRSQLIGTIALAVTVVLAAGGVLLLTSSLGDSPANASQGGRVSAAEKTGGSLRSALPAMASEPVAPQPDPTPVFASYRDLRLRLPVQVDKLTELGFHQASRDYALHMTTPLHVADDTTARKRKSTGGHPVKGSGADAVLGGSCLQLWRARPGKPDSAVDVGAAPGTPVLSPVDGEVVKIRHYKLYGKLGDWEIHIRPDAHPNIDLVVIHIDELSVKAGDRVQAGITRLATVRKISGVIDAQLADFTKGGGNHVHFQLNDASRPDYRGLKLRDDEVAR